MRYSLKLLFVLVLTTLARADGPADLRTTLNRLHGRAPVKAEVAYNLRQEGTTFFTPAVQEHSLRLQLAEGGSDLQVTWNPSPTGPASLTSIFMEEVQKDLGPARLDSLLNQASEMSGLLDAARFKSEGRESYQGKEVRTLIFRNATRIPTHHQSLVTQAESILKVWMDDDGVPLVTECSLDYTGRHSRLYGRIHGTSLIRTTYTVREQRLVVATRTSEAFLYDQGDRQKRHSTMTVAIQG
ncbi:MAG: hypothetical protein HXX12_08550 [Geothrix sp.]|uniref:hypothetical protein n=1 Tax=Geothrix sp. TaxID=1962974 RepID=UPI00179DA992|nr:hypothetical protein [Geothrix sp.]NWJ41006.1 hypothetical protein [Geothrix sp.]WIL20997.1 MAG: hypothetical protein QOZ81_000240 [Geothrix sp.]